METETPKPPKPFVSVAQRERCLRLVADGKMSKAQFDAADAVTRHNELPERLHPKAQ